MLIKQLVAKRHMNKSKEFYDKAYKKKGYATASHPQNHSDYISLKKFVEKYDLKKKKCLEIGTGRGAFQDLVEDYTGCDLSCTIGTNMRKPFVQGDATSLPFGDNQFDALWTIHTLEHIHEPELALSEMCRILKPSGLLYLAPAWHCRSWARDGYPVRHYSEFDLKGKIIKSSILIRNKIWYRAIFIFLKRTYRLIKYMIKPGPITFKYLKLNPNYDVFWMADSDACCSIDPYESILWFCSRGHICHSYQTWYSQFLVRTGPIVFRIKE